MRTHFEIQRKIDDHHWSRWATLPVTSSRGELHELLLKESRAWPTDVFRLVMVVETEIASAKGGDILARS